MASSPSRMASSFPSSQRYIGLMSGTSLDGVDGVLADFSDGHLRVLAHASQPWDAPLRARMLELNSPGHDELHRAALAANALAESYASVVQTLLREAQLPPQAIRAIGAHGQTVRHRPREFDGTGYTLQINNPSLLAERTGIAVVADFRSRDVAAGGQGAPLVPAFHQGVFGRRGHTMLVLNIGGISNLSVLPAHGEVMGFDCGPGNALMDAWCQTHTGAPFDQDGRWAAQGQIVSTLLDRLLQEPFLHQTPPKSTGRDLFNADWLSRALETAPDADPVDIQATLTEFTARACALAAQPFLADCDTLAVCGGGALNATLMHRLAALLPTLQVTATDALGLPALQVEAAAFAWLARQTVEGHTGSLQSVTGAQGARVLGGIYPA